MYPMEHDIKDNRLAKYIDILFELLKKTCTITINSRDDFNFHSRW